MSGKSTIRLINGYNQMAAPTMFLSGFFQSPEINFHSTEFVEIDIERSDEEVAIAIQDLSQGSHNNEFSLFTNKQFKPPIFSEEGAINSFDLLKRQFGETPFENPDFRANLGVRQFRVMKLMDAKIRRSMELQASQVLQTGIVSLINSAGTVVYVIDYKPKATHFVTAGTAWDTGGADIIGDIDSTAEVIRNDGLSDPNQLIMGSKTFEAFQGDSAIQNLYDNRRIVVGDLKLFTQPRGQGGNFQGTIQINNYQYEIWTYGGRFINPQTRVKTKFIDDDSCIVRVADARMDATFGAIPNIGRDAGIGSQVLSEFGGRINNVDGGQDLQTFMYMTVDGKQLVSVVEGRPLMIPTAIDTYGNIKTGV